MEMVLSLVPNIISLIGINLQQMQVKGIFRELGVTRELGDQAITLRAAYRERKPKGNKLHFSFISYLQT